MIITRDIIRDDATFNGYSKQDLCEFINYWKINLIDRGAKPGDKIGLLFDNTQIHYYALIFAGFELGMRVVTLHRPDNEKQCQSPKSNAHLPLDYFVYLKQYLTATDTSMGVVHFRKNAKQCISYGPLEWKIMSDTFRTKEETPIHATPDTVAFCCTSSGTTGDPKLIGYTHEFLYKLCQYNRSALGYDRDDKMVHLSSLNHGGVISLLLPALMTCKEHYFKVFSHGRDPVDTLVDDCIDKGITKVFFSNGGEVNCFLGSLHCRNKNLPNASLYLLSFISPKWKPIVKAGRVKDIVSVFGCSEICGPVFLPRLDIHNVDTFEPTYLGRPTTGFYDTRIVGDRIHTVVNDKEFVFDDIVREDDGVHFISKTRLSKINDIDINPLDIIHILEEFATRYVFEVYVDEVYNELYIITSKEDLVIDKVEKFYFGNVPVKMIYYPSLHYTRVNHKADSEKLKAIVEKQRKIDK